MVDPSFYALIFKRVLVSEGDIEDCLRKKIKRTKL